jgi:hypothetical protein
LMITTTPLRVKPLAAVSALLRLASDAFHYAYLRVPGMFGMTLTSQLDLHHPPDISHCADRLSAVTF